MTEWAAARNVRGLFDEEGRAAAVAGGRSARRHAGDSRRRSAIPPAKPRSVVGRACLARHLVDVAVGQVPSALQRPFRRNHGRRLSRVRILWPASWPSAVTAVFALIAAAKIVPLESLLCGAIGILTLLALQYVAGKSWTPSTKSTATSAGRLSSRVVAELSCRVEQSGRRGRSARIGGHGRRDLAVCVDPRRRGRVSRLRLLWPSSR